MQKDFPVWRILHSKWDGAIADAERVETTFHFIPAFALCDK